MIRKHFSRLKSWRSRLNFAVRFGLNEEEYQYLRKLQGWKCCAIGEAREVLEKRGVNFGRWSNSPQKSWNEISMKAYDLGVKFTDRIEAEDYAGALSVLAEIENLH